MLTQEDPEFLKASADLIKFYREYPEMAAEDLLNIKLSDIQKVVLRSMWFKNYVMAVMCRGAGKCVGKDSYIFTSQGILQIKDLMPKTAVLQDAAFSVSDGKSLAPAQKIYYDGVQTVNILETALGYSINATDDHPLLTMGSSGNLEWKKSFDIKEGDYVCISRGDNVWGSSTSQEGLSYYLGLLVGDGCLTRKNIVSFSSEDGELLSKFCALTKKLFSYDAKIRDPKDRCREVRIYSVDIRRQLENMGLDYTPAPGKKFPSYLLDKDRDSIISFLQGLFDTDGTVDSKRLTVSYCTSSMSLAEVVHLCLLNLGIVSRKRFKKNNKASAYIIDICGKDAILFKDIVGFKLSRKQNLLSKRCDGAKINTNTDIVPHQHLRFSRLFENTRGIDAREIRQRLHKYSNYYDVSYESLNHILSNLNTSNEDVYYLQELLKTNHRFDRVVKKRLAAESVYDLCMPEKNQHAFVCNGFINHNTFLLATLACLKAMLYPGHRVGLIAPTFRQSKLIFDECGRLYQRSPILQAACDRRPTQQSDNCYIRFKSVAGQPGSLIQAIPLGDGSKIRGSRFFTIVCDEFPHIESEIFNLVIRPMAATVSDPMENVERLQRQEVLLERGLISKEQIEDEISANQIIITSSGYFTFNHLYDLYKIYRDEMLAGNPKYAAFRVPYHLLPPGFLDKDNVEAAKTQMSSLEFRMEYEAAFIPDTDAFYKASLLDACSNTSFSTQVAGDVGKSYCLGIDPARSEDSFAICVVELGQPAKVTHALEIQKMPFPKMAQTIEDICSAFNVTKIYMDSQGGGHALKDMLAENPAGSRAGPILDPNDEVHQRKAGRHILEMCNFSTEFISESNFAALRLLEHREILFPSVPKDTVPTAAQEDSWHTIRDMKNQMQSIELTETATGKHHFDVPKGGGHGKQKKDLYTAFMLAARCVYDLLWSEVLPEDLLHHGGVMKARTRDRQQAAVEDAYGGDIPQVLRDKIEIAQDPEGYKQRMLQQITSGRKVLTSSAACLTPKPKKKGR